MNTIELMSYVLAIAAFTAMFALKFRWDRAAAGRQRRGETVPGLLPQLQEKWPAFVLMVLGIYLTVGALQGVRGDGAEAAKPLIGTAIGTGALLGFCISRFRR